jgi:DNA helicase-2/ATP-dependent DNA helicase PcrA
MTIQSSLESSAILKELNAQQREAVTFGEGPLLVVAGAGTGKTKTLACRVGYLLSKGVPPERILLLTFTRRAAEEMLKRASSINPPEAGLTRRVWGGTFHGMANRLLRLYAQSAGLSPDFTVLDRPDAEDFLNMLRTELKLANKDSRFPRKSTCLEIYSRRINGNEKLEEVLRDFFPWCSNWKEELKALFQEYTRRKQNQNVLDYDDLLLYWYYLLQEPTLAKTIGSRFDFILVDEYQDTNPIQARILQAMRHENRNIMAVGDDAQSIYSFRSASVRNMLDFPKEFPGTRLITLEQNYRSLPPILESSNRLIEQSSQRYAKNLWSERKGGEKPQLITCQDEPEQDEAVIKQILEHYEQGMALKEQAVLFRTSSHSGSLELALTRHNIPFHKFGGLRFLEAAHIKDLVGFLKIAENPKDQVAWLRILQLLKGVGPATASQVFRYLAANGSGSLASSGLKIPAEGKQEILDLMALVDKVRSVQGSGPSSQVETILGYYAPIVRRNYENPEPRIQDIEHLAVIARRYSTRGEFLAELILDPPASTGDLAGPPVMDEDYLILSTIHSAKGLEWKAVYLIHAADGNLPCDLATGDDEQIEEELRLTYVAMTRARDHLYVLWPLRYYSRSNGMSDNHSYAQCCRFFNESVTESMECISIIPEKQPDSAVPEDVGRMIFDRINQIWE